MSMELNLKPARNMENYQYIFDVNFLQLNDLGQIDMYRKALIEGIKRLEDTPICAETAQIYLGNPNDTSYVNKTVTAIYLGTYVSQYSGYNTYWLHRSHSGKIMVSSTFKDSIISTCGFNISNGMIVDLGADSTLKERAERILKWFTFHPSIPWCMHAIQHNDYRMVEEGKQIYLGSNTWIERNDDGSYQFIQGVFEEQGQQEWPAKEFFDNKTIDKLNEIFAH